MYSYTYIMVNWIEQSSVTIEGATRVSTSVASRSSRLSGMERTLSVKVNVIITNFLIATDGYKFIWSTCKKKMIAKIPVTASHSA